MPYQCMGKVISIRLSNEDYSMLEQKYGDNVSGTAKRLLLIGDVTPMLFKEKMRQIRENQKEMAKLSNANKALWKEIRKELGIE